MSGKATGGAPFPEPWVVGRRGGRSSRQGTSIVCFYLFYKQYASNLIVSIAVQLTAFRVQGGDARGFTAPWTQMGAPQTSRRAAPARPARPTPPTPQPRRRTLRIRWWRCWWQRGLGARDFDVDLAPDLVGAAGMSAFDRGGVRPRRRSTTAAVDRGRGRRGGCAVWARATSPWRW